MLVCQKLKLIKFESSCRWSLWNTCVDKNWILSKGHFPRKESLEDWRHIITLYKVTGPQTEGIVFQPAVQVLNFSIRVGIYAIDTLPIQ